MKDHLTETTKENMLYVVESKEYIEEATKSSLGVGFNAKEHANKLMNHTLWKSNHYSYGVKAAQKRHDKGTYDPEMGKKAGFNLSKLGDSRLGTKLNAAEHRAVGEHIAKNIENDIDYKGSVKESTEWKDLSTFEPENSKLPGRVTLQQHTAPGAFRMHRAVGTNGSVLKKGSLGDVAKHLKANGWKPSLPGVKEEVELDEGKDRKVSEFAKGHTSAFKNLDKESDPLVKRARIRQMGTYNSDYSLSDTIKKDHVKKEEVEWKDLSTFEPENSKLPGRVTLQQHTAPGAFRMHRAVGTNGSVLKKGSLSDVMNHLKSNSWKPSLPGVKEEIELDEGVKVTDNGDGTETVVTKTKGSTSTVRRRKEGNPIDDHSLKMMKTARMSHGTHHESVENSIASVLDESPSVKEEVELDEGVKVTDNGDGTETVVTKTKGSTSTVRRRKEGNPIDAHSLKMMKTAKMSHGTYGTKVKVTQNDRKSLSGPVGHLPEEVELDEAKLPDWAQQEFDSAFKKKSKTIRPDNDDSPDLGKADPILGARTKASNDRNALLSKVTRKVTGSYGKSAIIDHEHEHPAGMPDKHPQHVASPELMKSFGLHVRGIDAKKASMPARPKGKAATPEAMKAYRASLRKVTEAYDEAWASREMHSGAGSSNHSSTPAAKVVRHGVIHPDTGKRVASYDNTPQGKAKAAAHAVKIKGKIRQFTEELDMDVKNVEQLDEISLKTKINAYANREANAFEDDGFGDDVKRGDNMHRMIVKKHGEEAGEAADKAADVKTFGRKDGHGGYQSGDKLKKHWSMNNPRLRKDGKMNKQDSKFLGSTIKSRLGTHGKSNLPEEFELTIVKEGFQYFYDLEFQGDLIKEGVSVTESGAIRDAEKFIERLINEAINEEDQVDRIKNIVDKYIK